MTTDEITVHLRVQDGGRLFPVVINNAETCEQLHAKAGEVTGWTPGYFDLLHDEGTTEDESLPCDDKLLSDTPLRDGSVLLVSLSRENRALYELRRRGYHRKLSVFDLYRALMRSPEDAELILVAYADKLLERCDELTPGQRKAGTSRTLYRPSITRESIELLVSYGACVCSTDLEDVLRQGFFTVAQSLIELGACVDNKCLDTAYATSADAVMFLASQGADITSTSRNWTRLHEAAVRRYLPVIGLLVDKTDVNAQRGDDGKTPLHLSVTSRQPSTRETVQVLLQHGASISSVDNDGRTPIHEVVNAGNLSLARLLLTKAKASDPRALAPDNLGRTPLHAAVIPKYLNSEVVLDLVSLLLEHGVAPDTVEKVVGWTPLFYAVERGLTPVVSLLLSKGADIDAVDGKGKSPLHLAATLHSSEMAEFLLERGASPCMKDKEGWTPLYHAIENGNTRTIALLLSKGSRVKDSSASGETPLHIAARLSREAIIGMLLQHGASVNAKTASGCTPLLALLTARGTSPEHRMSVARLLVSRGADVSAADDGGSTPLHLAMSPEMAAMFLDRGASMNAKRCDGRTPLHVACCHHHPSIASVTQANHNRWAHVSFLLSRGADVKAVDNCNETPLDVARRNRSIFLFSALEEATEEEMKKKKTPHGSAEGPCDWESN